MVRLSSKLKKAFLITGLTGLIIGSSIFGYQNRVHERMFDGFFETKEEKLLESKINKKIYFNFSMGEERNEKIKLFAEAYNEARRNWDNFDEQTENVNTIFFDYSYINSKDIANVNFFNEVIINRPPKDHQTLHGVFIHEIAGHVFLNYVGESFIEKWKKISKNHYIKNYSKATTEDFIKNGSIKKRGIENFGEDFSYLIQFVYGVCHPNIKVIGLKNEEPKFRRKIDEWNKNIL